MRPDRRTSTIAALLGVLLLVTAIGGPATAAPAATTPAQPSEHATSEYAQTDAEATDNLTAEDILDGYRQRVSSLETLTLTVQSDANSSSYSSSSTQSIWVDFENNRIRTERNSSYGETVTVRNESGTVSYNVEENTVSRYDYTFDDQYGDQFGLGPVFNNSDVTYEGTETIGGTEAYRLDAEPETEYGDASYDVTIWLSTETDLPIQYEMSSDGEYSYEVTQRYTNVTVNETISDERFTIDIPDDAERPDTSTPEFYSYDSESELRANTSQSVPEPTVPENYSFDSGYVTDGEEYSSVTLSYTTDSDDSLTVSKRAASTYNYSQHDSFEEVTVGNRTGYYNEFDYGETNISILVWESGDHQYTVYGSLNESETIAVAESVAPE